VTEVLPKPSLFQKLKAGLSRTRAILEMPVEDLVRGQRPLEPADLEAIEEALMAADMGPAAVADALDVLRDRSRDISGQGAGGMREALRGEIRRALDEPPGKTLFTTKPWVVFVVGVNGVGKTTTIGKLAKTLASEDRSTLVCAADTFRAAAAEQLEVWAQRSGAGFHRGAEGGDPAAVLTDAIRMARARGIDVVLVDTAGRLHTKGNLMAELNKMARVAAREIEGAPHETLLVLDATTGANGLAQGREFAKAAGVTGIVLTKLDGTAKGGVAVAVVKDLRVPIRYVGVGEAIDDLLAFDADAFATGLLGIE
jgi:fused signal recognition particle receptor